MADLLKLAGRIAEITPSWFPIAGHVRNVTFTLDEADAVIEALNHAAGATNALAVRPAQDASKWSDRTTYVRKIADGQFEYGFLFRSTNFRKRPDVYNAEGVKATVCEAELARAQLEPAMATETHDELVADVMELIADGAQTDMPLEDIANNVILACRIPAATVTQDSIEAIIAGIGAADTATEQALEIVHALGRAGYCIQKYRLEPK
jgi:hypothetical protein